MLAFIDSGYVRMENPIGVLERRKGELQALIAEPIRVTQSIARDSTSKLVPRSLAIIEGTLYVK